MSYRVKRVFSALLALGIAGCATTGPRGSFVEAPKDVIPQGFGLVTICMPPLTLGRDNLEVSLDGAVAGLLVRDQALEIVAPPGRHEIRFKLDKPQSPGALLLPLSVTQGASTPVVIGSVTTSSSVIVLPPLFFSIRQDGRWQAGVVSAEKLTEECKSANVVRVRKT